MPGMAGTTADGSPGGLTVALAYLGRITGMVAFVLFAAFVTLTAGAWHAWNVHGARLSCPLPSTVLPDAEGYTVRAAQGGWAEPDSCVYEAADGRPRADLMNVSVGPVDVFDPLWSFIVASGIVVAMWTLALIGCWWTWGTRPRLRAGGALGT